MVPLIDHPDIVRYACVKRRWIDVGVVNPMIVSISVQLGSLDVKEEIADENVE